MSSTLQNMVRFLSLVLLAVLLWLTWAMAVPVAPAQPLVLLFPPGASTKSIAAELQRTGVLRNRHAFELLHYVMPQKKLKAGEYRFARADNAFQIFSRIARGDVILHTVVVPEGYNIFDIASAIEAAGLGDRQDFLDVVYDTDLIHTIDPQAKSLEGYLFPDTYGFSRTMSMRDIAAIMVKRFQREAQTLGLTHDVHRTVTLASIVEKETAAAEERPEIAGVYLNRLGKNMALAADPTVVYGALLNGTYRGGIYQSDLQSDSPYNTYKFAGMPPGPISNPGAASLRAAMQPAKTEFLFFVAAGDGSGHHHFSTSFEEHERNVLAYRKAASASARSGVTGRAPVKAR